MANEDLIRLDEQLCFMLYAGSRAMTRAYQPMLKDLQLTYPQYLVLMVLWEWAHSSHSEATVKMLGERLRLDSGTLTPLLKRLEQQNLVTRTRDLEDERRVMVAATEAGLALEKRAAQWLKQASGRLDATGLNVERLRQDLSGLLDVLSRHAG